MFEILKRLKEQGRLTEKMIANALAKGIITDEEATTLRA
jgi:hypothetical protein